MNHLNALYFQALKSKYDSIQSHPKLVFGENSAETDKFLENQRIFVPVSLLSEQDFSKIPVTSYLALKERGTLYSAAAQRLKVNVMKLLAGRGTSFSRDRFLKYMLGENCPASSSKGLDLIVDVSVNQRQVKLSIAELQVLQCLKLAQTKKLQRVSFQPLLSSDTADFLSQLESKPFPLHPKSTFSEFLEDNEEFQFKSPIIQEYLPTLSSEAELKDDYTAPGGHGFFAFSLLHQILESVEKDVPAVFHSISNGEDLNSSPNELVWGWMSDKQIPIVMITTEKTVHDLKGGQISLVKEGDEFYVSILERAQAEQVHQVELFESLGLRPEDRTGMFNTNTALFNEAALRDIFKQLLKRVTKESIIDALSPDLIMNKKTVNVEDSQQTRIQLEGAMGSVLLNFDRFCRKILGRGVVEFLQVPQLDRFDFFTPIKSALDYCLLFQSDLFEMSADFRNESFRPGIFQKVEVEFEREDWSTKDLLTMSMVFTRSKIRDLNTLNIRGPVFLKNMELSGRIELRNEHRQALSFEDWHQTTLPISLKDKRVTKLSNGKLVVEDI